MSSIHQISPASTIKNTHLSLCQKMPLDYFIGIEAAPKLEDATTQQEVINSVKEGINKFPVHVNEILLLSMLKLTQVSCKDESFIKDFEAYYIKICAIKEAKQG